MHQQVPPSCYKGVDTGGALGAEAPPDFQALQYIQYTCMEQIVEF